jgi:exopolysaccharide biosynthesis polyprenyl glycosylphosphotransferase
VSSRAWSADRRDERKADTPDADRQGVQRLAPHLSPRRELAFKSKRSSGSFPRRSSLVLELYRAADMAAVLAVLLTVFLIQNREQMTQGMGDFVRLRLTLPTVLLVALLAFIWRQAFLLVGLYEARECDDRWRDEAQRVVTACSIGAACALVLPLVSTSGSFGFDSVLYLWLGATAMTLGLRYVLRHVMTPATARPRRKTRRQVLIVGSGPLAIRAYRQTCSQPECPEVVGFVDSNNRTQSHEVRQRTIGTLEQLERILMHRVVDEVLIALPVKSCYAAFQRAVQVCERIGVEAKYFADIFRCSVARLHYEHSASAPAVVLKVTEDDSRLLVKRAIDVASALMLVTVLSPLLLAITAAIKLSSPGPAVFAQERYGLRKRRFRMFKFRTMVCNAEALQPSLECINEAQGPVFKIRNDPRVTRVGKFLRRTSLDELPQLFNVIRGEMSLVGPRPLPVRDVEHFVEPWPMRRFSVKPGLTCLWQISGRCNLTFDDWVRLDLEYIDTWSLRLDLRILLKTIPAVLRGAGAV